MSRPMIETKLIREEHLAFTQYGRVTRVRYRCPKCSFMMTSKTAKYCPDCGEKLRDE